MLIQFVNLVKLWQISRSFFLYLLKHICAVQIYVVQGLNIHLNPLDQGLEKSDLWTKPVFFVNEFYWKRWYLLFHMLSTAATEL